VLRRLGILASVGFYVALYIALSVFLMWLDVWRQFPGADQAIYRSRNLGLGSGYLLLMSLPSAAGFQVTLAVANAWRRRRNHPVLAALWIPVLSAVLAVGLTDAGVPEVLFSLTEALLGPESMWMLLTWPFGQAAIAAGMCVVVATVWPRGLAVSNVDVEAG
jgi:hypothetical protein